MNHDKCFIYSLINCTVKREQSPQKIKNRNKTCRVRKSKVRLKIGKDILGTQKLNDKEK